MERRYVRDTEIKHILKKALTDSINDREVYIKGVTASIITKAIPHIKPQSYKGE